MGHQFIKTFLILSIFISSSTLAASCCGGGSALPTLITGDNRAQFVAQYINNASTYIADEDGLISKRSEKSNEVTETLNLSGVYQWNDYLQIGLQVPVKFSHKETIGQSEKSSGLGDPHIMIGYEFLPEYSFSYWKPRGFIFIDQAFPVAHSTYDAQKMLRTDSLGRGFFTTSLGVAFVKTLSSYDFLFMTEVHKGFKRSFDDSSVSSVAPGWGTSSLLSFGYSPQGGLIRLGAGLTHYVEEGAVTWSFGSTQADKRYYLEGNLIISYLYGDYSISMTYADQSFFGHGKNSALGQSFGFGVTKFFPL